MATRTNAVTGTSSLATTTATFGFSATAGRLLILTVAADDYRSATPTGYTLSAGMAQEGFLGHYLFWKVAAGGENNVQYTIGSASPSCWTVEEWSGLDTVPYDTSTGALTTSGGDTNATPTITPSNGARFIYASIGGSTAGDTFTGMTSWTNSFSGGSVSFQNTGSTRDITGTASRSVTGDGVTTFSTEATYTSSGEPAANGHRTALIISFKEASATDTPLTVTNGSLSLTGQDVTLVFGDSVSLSVTNASLTLNGQDVPLIAGASVTIPVTNATMALEGSDVAFLFDSPWVEGTITLFGSNVTLTAQQSVTLTVTEGTLGLTGQSVTLLADFDYTVAVDNGALTLTGQDVTFSVGAGNVVLNLTEGTLSLTGSDVGINPSITISGTGAPRRKRFRGIRRLLNVGR